MHYQQQRKVSLLLIFFLFSSFLQVSSQNGFAQYFGTCINERTRDTSDPVTIGGVVVSLISVKNETFVYHAVSGNDGIFIFLVTFEEGGGDVYRQTLNRSGYEREVHIVNITQDGGNIWGLRKETHFESFFLLLILVLFPLFWLICCAVYVAKRINENIRKEALEKTLMDIELRSRNNMGENIDSGMRIETEFEKEVVIMGEMEAEAMMKEGKKEIE